MKEQSMISTSSEVIGSIDDLLIEILLHLPVKSLLRFKLVSKKWKSIICSPFFYLQYHAWPNPAVGMFYHDDMGSAVGYIHLDVRNSRKPPFRKLKFGEDTSPFWIHHSCNGLLLCCSTKYLDYDCYGERTPISRFYVYNPTTNCFRKLPRPGVVSGVPRIIRGISLAFDPAKSSLKVVCVRECEFDADLRQIEIYSAECDEWRVSGEPFISKASFDNGVYWNGSIHWINTLYGEILFFNINQERFGKMPLPADPKGRVWRIFYYFGESCDHLHLIPADPNSPATGVDVTVYEMQRDCSDWFVKYRVHLISAAFSEIGYFYPDVYYLSRGKNESPFLVFWVRNKVIRFNLDCNTFEEIYVFGRDDLFPYSAYGYIESLHIF